MKSVAIKKIFVDAHVFDTEFQGTRTFLKEIYNILSKKDDLQIYIAANNIEILKSEFPDHTNIVFVKYRFTSSVLRLTTELPYLLNRLKIDIAHFQYIVPPFKNTKHLVTTHDVLFNEYPGEFSKLYRYTRNILFGFSARKADYLTTVSEYSRNSIIKHLGINDKEIYVIPNGVNKKFFESYDKPLSEKYIQGKYGVSKFLLYVSRFEPRKNQLLVLQSFLQLKLYEKDFHLVFLGHTSIPVPEFDQLIFAQPSHIQERIFISSQVNDSDLLEFYRAAAVFVYASKAEGFGIPPLEAGALKIPVLCSNTSAMSDFTFFGENHFDPNNYDEFTAKLKKLILEGMEDNELKKISAVIQEKFLWENSAEKLYKLLIAKG